MVSKLLPLQPGTLPDIAPGQFVQVEVPNSKTTYLRRPISVNYVQDQELWLLVRRAGAGTAALCDSLQGARLNLVLPLGRGFTTSLDGHERILLVGGGVGVAPLLQLGKVLKDQGRQVHFLLGARTAADVLELDLFQAIGPVDVATEDGSDGAYMTVDVEL